MRAASTVMLSEKLSKRMGGRGLPGSIRSCAWDSTAGSRIEPPAAATVPLRNVRRVIRPAEFFTSSMAPRLLPHIHLAIARSHHLAAVRHDHLAGGEGGLLAPQVEDRMRDVLRVAHS